MHGVWMIPRPPYQWGEYAVKQVSGSTPKELIDNVVVAEIKVMLRYTDLTVQQIAYHLDISSESFLCRFFLRMTGFTPLEYRKKHAVAPTLTLYIDTKSRRAYRHQRYALLRRLKAVCNQLRLLTVSSRAAILLSASESFFLSSSTT